MSMIDEPRVEELIRRAREGDREACGQLYEHYADRVHALVRRLVGTDLRAEDWAQEAWLRAFRSLSTFRGDARFTTWLHRIVVNTVLQGVRQTRGSESRLRVTLRAELPDAAAPADHPVLRIALEAAIDALPPRMRHVLVLHDIEGYTHEEIADMVGISPGTSKSQLFKARAKLRERLAPAPTKNEGERACAT